jgi:hypothetical protein
LKVLEKSAGELKSRKMGSDLARDILREQYKEAWNIRRYWGNTRTTVTIVPTSAFFAMTAFVANNVQPNVRFYVVSMSLFLMLFFIGLSINLWREVCLWIDVIDQIESRRLLDDEPVSVPEMRRQAKLRTARFPIDKFSIIHLLMVTLLYSTYYIAVVFHIGG